MKNIIKYITIFVLLAAFVSCNDDYMDRYPIETPSEITAFKNSENFKTYSWSLYSIFADNTDITRTFRNGAISSYYEGDRMANYIRNYSRSGISNEYADHRVSPSTAGGWTFSFIRNVNVMLENIDNSQMTQDQKDHWRSIGYFFRAYNYVELIMRYGDVPWIDKVLSEDEAINSIPPRLPRVEVANKVMEELIWARDNIDKGIFSSPDVDGKNTVNKFVINALISRFGLYEGTWYKYHNVPDGDATKFLNESIKASEVLMAKYPNIDNDYDAAFNIEDGSQYVGSILYKEYAVDQIMHNVMQYLRSTSMVLEATKQSVDMFLMSNGKPIHHPDNIAIFNDKTMNDEFRNRDMRLYLNVIPPYKCTGANTTSWGYTTGPDAAIDREYIDLMQTIAPAGRKRLPVSNWAGNTLNIIPHYFRKSNGNVGAPGFMVCNSGYYLWKDYNTWDKTISGISNIATADKQIFTIDEVLINYAEAKWEKGEFTQDIADNTINKFRRRASTADMKIADINASFDPDRDKNVDPLLWEIRRERFVELFCQGFGFYDIRRWKVAPWFINQQPKGQYIRRTDQGGLPAATMMIEDNAKEGYLVLEPTTPVEAGKGWDDTFYLFPIPASQLVLNPALKQNSGWERY